MSKKILISFAAFLISVQSVGYGQTLSDSLLFNQAFYSSNKASSLYEKQLNTHTLRSGLNYGIGYNNFFSGLNYTFSSTLIKSNRSNIRDEQYISFITEYGLLHLLDIGLSIYQNSYADDRNLAINKSSSKDASLFIRFKPIKELTIIPHAGLSSNTQVGIEDEGIQYGSSVRLLDLKLSDFEINSVVSFNNEEIEPRKNTDRLVNISVENDIDNNLSNSITAFYSENRKDFYIETDSLTESVFSISKNIQSRSEKNYFIREAIQFNPGQSPFGFNVDGKITWRDIDRETRYNLINSFTSTNFDSFIEEFRLDFSSAFTYNSKNVNSIVRVVFSDREEKHNAKYIKGINDLAFTKRRELEAQKNHKSQLTTFSTLLNWKASSSDLISFSIFHRKLIYDTPSTNNFDDRDELLSMANISYTRSLNPYFDAYINLEGSINQIVYIFSERSSNNNKQRTLKFTGGGTYRGAIFSTRNDFEVSANYTVYDFEDLNPNFKSFAFRQFAFKDSSSIKISKNVYARIFAYMKLSEQGDFLWSEFKGKPVRFVEELFFEPIIEFQYRDFEFGAGLRYFNLSTFSFDEKSVKILETDYLSFGPLSTIRYYVRNKASVNITGWFEFIRNEGNNLRKQANLQMEVRWNI
ncbi:MAG: hypothetical protein JW995_11005 [Melioribacteraceae bacterium]|nr:hypothetical protein [Melioribacteraceae bacterium]